MAELAAADFDLGKGKQAFARMAVLHYALLDANRALKGLTPGDADHDERVRRIDAAALALAEGKWHLLRATGDCADFAIPSHSNADVEVAASCFAIGQNCLSGQHDPSSVIARLERRDEIEWLGEAPILPSICPIVLLQGTPYEMGMQYSAQCIQIFGSFVFSGSAHRVFSPAQSDIIERWEAELRRHVPDIISFAEGMAKGATQAGLPLTRQQAMALWTGWDAPATELQAMGVPGSLMHSIMSYFGTTDDNEKPLEPENAEPCSGVAAWGSATKDGSLVMGATTDHDCCFQATIVAYPSDGHAYIYTPFSVNGSIPGVGYFQFAGLPGINAKGLAYVHHGGGIGGGAEPKELWGFGIKRGPSTFHILSKIDNARDALKQEIAWPTGDAARMMGSPGGFYADPNYGYVLESRGNGGGDGSEIVREQSMDAGGQAHPFLYANNNVISPKSGYIYAPPEGGYNYDFAAGWHVMNESKIYDPNMAIMGRRMMSKSSYARNCYLSENMLRLEGEVDLAAVKLLYEQGPRQTDEPWSRIEERLKAGEKLPGSVSHRGNAFTALAAFGAGKKPEYWGCIGSAAGRALLPNRTGHGYYYYDETGCFWRLSLEASPEELVAVAEEEARRLIADAKAARKRDGLQAKWISDADTAYKKGAADIGAGLSALAARLRQFAIAQVRARQVLRASAV
jgi:hypothetical protein